MPRPPRRRQPRSKVVRVEPLTGAALDAALDDLAALRIAVFRDWPYLYDGDDDYERGYLKAYARSDRAVVIGAYDDDVLVGAATAAPMMDHAAEFAAPFRAHGLDLGDIYYFGESVLLPGYRGHGIGHSFFDLRETAAREHGFATTAFCAVVRPDEHPMKPAGYRSLDGFWTKRGYAPAPGLVAAYPWADLGAEGAQVLHPMQFWTRDLKPRDGDGGRAGRTRPVRSRSE